MTRFKRRRFTWTRRPRQPPERRVAIDLHDVSGLRRRADRRVHHFHAPTPFRHQLDVWQRRALLLRHIDGRAAIGLHLARIGAAQEIGVSPRPFLMAVTVAASCAFALPMGYQTHMMVYGPGGYKFADFLKVGIPLNIICWVVSCLLIPVIWPF